MNQGNPALNNRIIQTIKYAFNIPAEQHMIPIISEIHIMGLLFNIKSKRKLALIYYITYSSLISVKTPAIGVENITSSTRKHIHNFRNTIMGVLFNVKKKQRR